MKKLVLGLALVAALGACSRAGSTPGATVEEFAKRLDSGNCNIKELLAKGSRDMAGDKLESVCKLGAEQNKNKPDAQQQRLKAVHILETKEEGDRATVRAEAENNAGQKNVETFVLVREDGSWKLDLLATGAGGMGGPSAPPPTMPTAPAPVVPAPTMPTPEAAPPADEIPAADAPAPAEEGADKE